MPITINGSGTVTGISAGGLPDGVITTDDIAANAVTQAKRSEQLTLSTAQASTSGTYIDFTGIPSWVKRVTVMFDGVSTNGSSIIILQLGTSSGFVTSGYNGSLVSFSGAGANGAPFSNVNGIRIRDNNLPSLAWRGNVIFTTLGNNSWVTSGSFESSIAAGSGSSSITFLQTLSGTLDRIRITTVNGTDTFDAGTINILYE